MERGRIGIPDDPAVLDSGKIRVPFGNSRDPPAKRLQVRGFIFKGDRRVFHLRSIDCQDFLRVADGRIPDFHSDPFPYP